MIIERFDSALHGQQLRQRLGEEAGRYPMQLNWEYLNWESGERFGAGQDEQIPSASTRKVSLLMGALSAVHAGALDPNDSFTTVQRRYDVDSGIFHRLDPGIKLKYKDAMKAMIMLSDNASTVAITERFGGTEYFNRYVNTIGLKKTVHRQALPDATYKGISMNLTSTSDIVDLFGMIETGCNDETAAQKLRCSPELCKFAITILKQNKLNDRLPALLPKKAMVAHKTGTLPLEGSSTIADTGIIYATDGKPLFTLAIFGHDIPDEYPDGMPGKAATALIMSRMARICYDAAV